MVDELDATVGEALLAPTRIYCSVVQKILRHYTVKNVVHGIAHITGGGLLENVGRILPDGTQAVIKRDCWTVPTVFDWLQRLGDVDADEMDRVFNRGLGLVFVVSDYYAGGVEKLIAEHGLESWRIGTIEKGSGSVWA